MKVRNEDEEPSKKIHRQSPAHISSTRLFYQEGTARYQVGTILSLQVCPGFRTWIARHAGPLASRSSRDGLEGEEW